MAAAISAFTSTSVAAPIPSAITPIPTDISPTVFAFAYEIPPAPVPDKSAATPFTVATARDLRWQRCNIKSTSLLGNVMHYQQGHAGGPQ